MEASQLSRTLAVIFLVIVLCVSNGMCDETHMNWHSANSGGGLSSNATGVMNCSVGQGVVGFVNNAKSLSWIGFWTGDMSEPVHVASIGEAKGLVCGTFISLGGKVATTSSSDFPKFCYVEEAMRQSGIRVAPPSDYPSAVARGDVVNVIGIIEIGPEGERQISGSMASIDKGPPLRPLCMNNRAVGGGESGCQRAVWGWWLAPSADGDYEWQWGEETGLNNIGLLITTFGQFVKTSDTTFTLDDGSGVMVKCVVPSGVNLNQPWTYTVVTGISSCEKVGEELHRLLRVREQDDIVGF
jgi:hypothetical protein